MPLVSKSVIGIVGSEEAKFDLRTRREAITVIRRLLRRASKVVSGACHLGGIDRWAADEATKAGIEVVEHAPTALNWPAYRERNLRIVEDADEVVCITVRELPEGYRGMRFDHCYHCRTDEHVKSGGCWTVKQAIRAGKVGRVVVVG